jgi:hypothetical protein
VNFIKLFRKDFSSGGLEPEDVQSLSSDRINLIKHQSGNTFASDLNLIRQTPNNNNSATLPLSSKIEEGETVTSISCLNNLYKSKDNPSDFDNAPLKNRSVTEPLMKIVRSQSCLEDLSLAVASTGVLNNKLTRILGT